VSQQNVEIVREVLAAWNAGDMDAVCELHDPDVIMRMAEGWPEPGPFTGREAFMRELERRATRLTPTLWSRSATTSTSATASS